MNSKAESVTQFILTYKAKAHSFTHSDKICILQAGEARWVGRLIQTALIFVAANTTTISGNTIQNKAVLYNAAISIN